MILLNIFWSVAYFRLFRKKEFKNPYKEIILLVVTPLSAIHLDILNAVSCGVGRITCICRIADKIE